MTKDIINKLHELEKNRDKWIKFHDALKRHNNLCVQDVGRTPTYDVFWMHDVDEEFKDLKVYLMTYIEDRIDHYNNEIEKL